MFYQKEPFVFLNIFFNNLIIISVSNTYTSNGLQHCVRGMYGHPHGDAL